MKSARILRNIGLCLAFAGTSAHAVTITYQTGDFASSEWSSHISPTSTGTGTATTEASGGNPGAYRRVSLMVDPFESVHHVELWSLAAFTPAVQGSVLSASLSYDVARVFTTNPFATQIAKGIAVRQDGIIYTHLLGVSEATPASWDSVAVADMLPLFPLVNWANGSTITFGILGSVGTATEGFTIAGGYDNFHVEVNAAAVPDSGASALLLGFGVLALLPLYGRRIAHPA